MNFRILKFVVAAGSLACSAASAGPQKEKPSGPAEKPPISPRLICTEKDNETAASLRPHLQQGQQKVERFFGEPFKKSFDVEIFPDRAAFDEYFRKRWKLPKTSTWMVASGVADRLTILSPRVWKTQAVEHNPADAERLRDLIAHELVHVYHGQRNPRPDFDGMDESGWFVEGLAVYASGQLERSHRTAASGALKAGKAPASLADAWSGRHRYGVSGSMVEFVDKRYGRDAIKRLLTLVNNQDMMKMLKTTESEFIEAWKAYVRTQAAEKQR